MDIFLKNLSTSMCLFVYLFACSFVAFALPRASSIMALVFAVLRASSTTAPLMMKTTALMSPAPVGLAPASSAGQP